MAEVQQHESRNKRGGIRSKKLSTRVDLTPMVDLGFLLITFFIFTTTLSRPSSFNLVVPDDRQSSNPPSLAPGNKTISLILEANDSIRFYEGTDITRTKTIGYAAPGLRTIIMNKIQKVRNQFGNKAEIIVLIKPTAESSYRNVVTVLNEMLINGVKKYVLMEPSAEEIMRF
jgi:biopolymer transport protein ExbD